MLSVVIYHGQYRAKTNLLICSLFSYDSVLALKMWHFVPYSLLSACFLSLGQDLGQPAPFAPPLWEGSWGKRVFYVGHKGIGAPQNPAFVTSRKSVCRWAHLGGAGVGSTWSCSSQLQSKVTKSNTQERTHPLSEGILVELSTRASPLTFRIRDTCEVYAHRKNSAVPETVH